MSAIHSPGSIAAIAQVLGWSLSPFRAKAEPKRCPHAAGKLIAFSWNSYGVLCGINFRILPVGAM